MRRILVASILMAIASSSWANSEFDSAMSAMCEKTKSCAIAEMKKSLPPEMQEMAIGMAAQACTAIQQSYSYLAQQAQYGDLMDSATACMKSMGNLECEALMAGPETQACKDYEKQAEKFQADFQ
ncbi:MAG: hypothetical protein AB8B86_01400 [Pseudomonadales bacterium]